MALAELAGLAQRGRDVPGAALVGQHELGQQRGQPGGVRSEIIQAILTFYWT